jgi:hypothetical protein
MVETHMLKPYDQRVAGTYALLEGLIGLAGKYGDSLRTLKKEAIAAYQPSSYYPIGWEVDSARHTTLTFKGYKADTVQSEVTGFPRLLYHADQPVQSEVTYFNQFRPTDSIQIPTAYLIPRAWERVRERLDWNGISYHILERDTTLQVTAYRIEAYSTYSRPYEGHYPHYDTRISSEVRQVPFRAGDLWVPTRQEGVRYLLETLDPRGVDSFFNWNFFDTVLQRKEGFSPYVFEEIALSLLQSDSLLRMRFEEKKQSDPNFASSAYSQLNWIYRQSPHYEAAHLVYPVYRLE